MYYFIEGEVTMVMPDSIVVCNGGIGYSIFTPQPYQFEVGKKYRLYTYLHVREDVMALFGFETEKRRALFLQLLSVKGIGPKAAQTILGASDVEGLQHAIETSDVAYFKKIPGVGPKSASQIILDLRGKVVAAEQIKMQVKKVENVNEDGKAALLALGYSEKELAKVLPQIDVSLPVSDYIKAALAMLLK